MDDNLKVVDKRLDLWLAEQTDPGLFPPTSDSGYPARYVNISATLNKGYHTQVELQNILTQIHDGNVSWETVVHLTNHGAGHVEKVIEKASDLVKSQPLSPYEVYLLLMGIQFHDIGNAFGREEHEKKAWRVMQGLGMAMGEDAPEKRTILDIAAAHGGLSGDDRDTIGRLERDDLLMGQHVRIRFLAATLRFADELADDRTRASRFPAEIPPQSKIFHEYSRSLHTVQVEKRTVFLQYEFDRTTALAMFQMREGPKYLLDEILDRTLKMHLERAYCARFLRSYGVEIESVRVAIRIYGTFETGALCQRLWETEYELADSGYPKRPECGISVICPQLEGVSGESVSAQISGGNENA